MISPEQKIRQEIENLAHALLRLHEDKAPLDAFGPYLMSLDGVRTRIGVVARHKTAAKRNPSGTNTKG